MHEEEFKDDMVDKASTKNVGKRGKQRMPAKKVNTCVRHTI
jgi:hypothetical protein